VNDQNPQTTDATPPAQPEGPQPRDPATTADRQLVEHFEELRPRLVGVAYGLLGSVAEAEDAVQEAWIRLHRTVTASADPQADVEPIDDLTGWLVTTTSRIALDQLRSARHRRESYVGPWLPEPVETAPDPADSVSLADSLNWAMLVVLETLTPAERAAFVLHDVFGLPFDEVATALGRSAPACRKLASRAREHVEARKPRFDVDPEAHRDVVAAFGEAATSGDIDRLLQLLAPDAVFTSDGGGIARAALQPISGADKIARFFAGTSGQSPRPVLRATLINGNPGLVYFVDGHVVTVMALGIRDGRITTVDAVRNPHKFHGLRTTTAGD
jgi:RNA polymerase sigma-70 factor (ECF subfamily)